MNVEKLTSKSSRTHAPSTMHIEDNISMGHLLTTPPHYHRTSVATLTWPTPQKTSVNHIIMERKTPGFWTCIVVSASALMWSQPNIYSISNPFSSYTIMELTFWFLTLHWQGHAPFKGKKGNVCMEILVDKKIWFEY